MRHWTAAAAIAVFTLLSFYQFPGHTWLQQDSQIYVPILEHLRDPSVLAKDILVQRPHVTFTIYDEVALGLRRLTGLGFREVLEGQQIVTRALGIWGFYLLATAADLDMAAALLVTAILSLGGMIAGPQVLIFEFEPTPRAFAVPLLILAIGLAAHRRFLAAGIAGSAAFLIHPPTVYPFWTIYTFYAARTFWRKREAVEPVAKAFLPLLASGVILYAAAHFQTGEKESQAFFTRITPLIEKLQRMRTSYVWISVWWKEWMPHYLLLCTVAGGAYTRIRRHMTPELRIFSIGLVVIGMLSLPLSWLLLEDWKWALMPQLQPVRALLFVAFSAIFLTACAGCLAARTHRYLEAFFWFAAAYVLPVNTSLISFPDWHRVAVIVILGAIATAGVRFGEATAAAAALAAFFLIPTVGRVVNYPRLHTEALLQLSDWARTSTPPDSVFLFPNFAKDLSPGIFRAEAMRAVYVDWKGGGQVNYLKDLGEQWWSRWQQATGWLPMSAYREMGVDYLVVHPRDNKFDQPVLFKNSQFVVYRVPHGSMSRCDGIEGYPTIGSNPAVRLRYVPRS